MEKQNNFQVLFVIFQIQNNVFLFIKYVDN